MASEPVERFAAEADNARARVASTIDAIQDRLDPRRLFGDTLERVSSGSAQLFGQVRQNAGSVVRSHPLAIGAAIAAVGVALLARSSLAKARVDLGDEYGNYTDYDDGFGYVDPVPTASAAAPVARQRLGVAADRAREIAANAGSSIESNPIVSIVLGLAAGAILGALFPATEAERNFLAGKD
jgi:ElaB/YqjD/DUF883 family membrane-anchored ribosome-binding protein